MTFPLAHHDPADEENAALWAARLDGGKLSATELREFDAWLAGHPARRELIAEYSQFAVDVGTLGRSLAAEGRVPAPPPAAIADSRPTRRWTSWAVGGLAAAAVALVALLRPAADTPVTPLEVATATARRNSLALADGTLIDLSARTRMSIALGKTERRVQMSAGHAFFAVAKDASKPFTIDTPAGSVLVTGTRFAVAMADDSHLEVTVQEGSVRVTPNVKENTVTLGAGERLRTGPNETSVEVLAPGEIEDALAWREGRIVFQATPLPEALAHFGRFHGRQITTAPELAQMRIGGRYNLDDLEGFLAAVEEIQPIVFTRSPDGSIHATLRTSN